MSASDVSPFHLRFARFTQLSDTCRRPLLGVWFLCLFVFCLLRVLVSPLVFCKWQRCLTSFFIYTALGDRQCFHARSALRYKKKKIVSGFCLVGFCLFFPLVWFVLQVPETF